MDSDADKLKALVDKDEIRDVLLRYCRGVDRCDGELIASCFHSDAVDDHGAWSALAPTLPGRIIASVRRLSAVVTHFMGNCLIEFDGDGDVAFAETYFLASHDFKRGGRRFMRVRAGRYVDRFERREGQWRVAERVVVDDWNHVNEVVERLKGEFRYGSRDTNDPVYAIRRGPVARQPIRATDALKRFQSKFTSIEGES